MRKKLAIYIGRFQPFHNGHLECIKETLENHADHVAVLVGSSNIPRTIKNPFTFKEREGFILNSLRDEGIYSDRVQVFALNDYIYNEKRWQEGVQECVETAVEYFSVFNDIESNDDISIVGYTKDESSYYLKTFPQWGFINLHYHPLETKKKDAGFNATFIREMMFDDKLFYIRNVIPKYVYNRILDFKETGQYESLYNEWQFANQYKAMWASAPFPPTFVTTDAMVVQSGHILLIRRKINPGKGLWGLPGGFIDVDEPIETSMLRELKEETKIGLKKNQLKRYIKSSRVFDDPNRSTRGRTITHLYLIRLDDSLPFPEVKGSDDAAEARWVPLNEFKYMQREMFEDHWHMIDAMLNEV